jgi:hypothetical protein
VGYDISPLKRVKFKILTTSRQAIRLVVKILNLTLLSREISLPTWASEGEFVSPII